MGKLKLKKCSKTDCFRKRRKKYTMKLLGPDGKKFEFQYCSRLHCEQAKLFVKKRMAQLSKGETKQ